MAEFLTTNGTSYHIENIMIGAQKKLILISPYLQISKTFFERLRDASKKNVSIKIIFGKDDLKPNEKNSLAELKNLELLYFENLHAKCYFNEKEMVITSMNMYEFSEKNNREMGIYLTRESDKSIYDKAVEETFSITQSSEVIPLSKTKRKIFQNQKNKREPKKIIPSRGYCIRCEERIKYNTEKPYCPDCYSIWSQYENPDYQEDFCHCCGEFESTSLNKPECYDCFIENKKSFVNGFK